MADIRITPAASVMAFTSSLNFKETLTQEASGSLTLLGSGSTGRTDLFTVNGNNGTLFSVSDDLSNSLFSVNTIAGLPVIEAFANNTVIMGQYGQNVLVVTGSRVGIGIATPSSKLHLNGTTTLLTITDTTYNRTSQIGYIDQANLYLANDNSSHTYIGAYNNLYLAYGGGKVGIGVTGTPSAKLQINFDDDLLTRTLILKNVSSGSFSAAAMDFQTTNNSPFSILQFNNTIASYAPGDVIFLNQASNSKIWFGNSGNSNRVVIANNNSVGIGTSTPAYTLDVSGSGNFNNGLTVTGSLLNLGSLTVGNITSTPSNENTLNVYPSPAGGVGEGGQILLAASDGAYTSASMVDTWQNQFRLLKGTNTGGSTAGLIYVDLQTGNTNFVGAITSSAYSGLPNDYLYATRSGSAQTVGSAWANTDIIFNNTVISKGISYNTGTGIASLTGGKVYRITARLAWGAAATYNFQFSCYTSTNTKIGPDVEIVQSSNGTSNISDGTLEFIYAPGSNTDIKIRCTANNTALSGENIRADLNTQFIIQQIA